MGMYTHIHVRAYTCNDSNDHDNKDLFLGFGDVVYVPLLPLLYPRFYTSAFQDDLASVSRSLLHLLRVCRREVRFCCGSLHLRRLWSGHVL